MPFGSVKDIVDAYDNGRWHHQRVFRSTSIYSAVTAVWFDYSMSGGTPKFNAYIGNQLESTALIGSGNNGIFTGPTPAAGRTKHIAKIAVNTMSTTVPAQRAMLNDYLMFYPLIDADSVDLQEFVQADALPRYADGLGVKMALVVTGGAQYSSAYATITYTNHLGVSGRTVTTGFQWFSLSNIACSPDNLPGAVKPSPFISLANGDLGVRSVESIQFSTGTGVFCALVLYKPICDLQILESATVAEIDYVNQRLSLPRVYDGAYLGFFATGSAMASTTLPFHAGIDFIWN